MTPLGAVSLGMAMSRTSELRLFSFTFLVSEAKRPPLEASVQANEHMPIAQYYRLYQPPYCSHMKADSGL